MNTKNASGTLALREQGTKLTSAIYRRLVGFCQSQSTQFFIAGEVRSVMRGSGVLDPEVGTADDRGVRKC